MNLSHPWSTATPLFDDEDLVSDAGLVPVMALAEQAGLSELIAERVALGETRVASAGVNPAGKLSSIIAGMAAGADSIDDLQVIRSGGMTRLFEQVYAPATFGQLPARVLPRPLCAGGLGGPGASGGAVATRTDLLAGIHELAFIDIDSLLRPVYGHAKQGASFGHTKIAGKQVLRKGLSPLATTISTRHAAPVLAGNPGCGPARPARARVPRRWSARRSAPPGPPARPGNSGPRRLRLRHQRGRRRLRDGEGALLGGADQEPRVAAAISAIPEQAWTPVHYPGAVLDPDTGALISDAQVAETTFTAFASTKHPVTARLIVRRVRDQTKQQELFPVWRYHPFFTNGTEPTAAADLTQRQHAVIETVFADLIDGPLAHL